MKSVSGKRLAQLAVQKGWMLRRVNGSHHVFIKSDRDERLVIPVHGNKSLKEVKELSWRAQNRLHARFVRLSLRQLNRNKVVVAVARELCGFIWELMRLVTVKTQENAALASGAGRSQKSTKGRTYMLKRS